MKTLKLNWWRVGHAASVGVWVMCLGFDVMKQNIVFCLIDVLGIILSVYWAGRAGRR